MATWPIGGGTMSAWVRAFDWRATSLGPIETWSHRLKAVVDIVFDSRQPMFVAAGPDLVMIYNETYATFLSGKHPQALGAPFREVFEEISGRMEPMLERTMAGEQQIMLDQYFALPWRTEAPDGWFTAAWTPIREEGGKVVGLMAAITETTDRHMVQRVLSEREEHQGFLLKLSDAIRAEVDPLALGSLATRMLGEHMGADRCWISRISHEEGLSRLGPEYRRIGMAPVSGEYPLVDFPGSVQQAETVTLVSGDVASDRALSALDKAGYEAMGVGAHVAAILRRGERNSVWGLSVGFAAPRAWTDAEVTLVEEAAERIWAAAERARADAALRDTEERFRQFAEASASGLWIRNAETLKMEYASRAISRIYGVDR